MSIKIEEVSQPQEFVYPLAFKLTQGEELVLFFGPKTGFNLSTGSFDDDWVDHTDTKTWKPVNITISHP